MREVTLLLASIGLLLWSMAAHPEHMRAPQGWYFEGVRPDGRTTLRPTPTCEDCYDDSSLDARIYCTSGTRAIVVDFRTVGCQR